MGREGKLLRTRLEKNAQQQKEREILQVNIPQSGSHGPWGVPKVSTVVQAQF